MDKFSEEILGKYTIEREVGSGGMARVYLATLFAFDKPVAIKILHRHLSEDQDYIKRFHREARAAIKLPLHPRVAFVHDSGRFDDFHFIVMEYVDGTTLKDCLQHGRISSLEHILDITRQILEALEFIQEHQIIHRDVKPSNVIIQRDGSVKLTDFGIAREIQAKDITQTDGIIGTPEYMSPEQASGGKIDIRSDVFSVGCVMYEMLAGTSPFAAPTALSSLYKVMKMPPDPIENHVPLIPGYLGRLVHRALQKEPRHRFSSAKTMLDELMRVRSLLSPEVLAMRPAGGTGPVSDDTVLRYTNRKTGTARVLSLPERFTVTGWSGWKHVTMVVCALGVAVAATYFGKLLVPDIPPVSRADSGHRSTVTTRILPKDSTRKTGIGKSGIISKTTGLGSGLTPFPAPGETPFKKSSSDTPAGSVPETAFTETRGAGKPAGATLRSMRFYRHRRLLSEIKREVFLTQYTKVIRTLQPLADDRSITPELQALLGLSYYKMVEPRKALTHIKAAVDNEPGNAMYHFNLAAVYDDLGARLAAVKHFRIAVNYDPNVVMLHGGFCERLMAADAEYERDRTLSYLGISAVPNSTASGAVYGMRIIDIDPASPAARSAMRREDIMTHVDGEPVTCLKDINSKMGSIVPGEALFLRIIRGRRIMNYTFMTGKQPPIPRKGFM